jgi:hypothetical protein
LERSNESFVIEIRGADKVETLMNKEFGGDFELMSTHLKIMNKRMVLLNPRFVKKHQSANDVNATENGNGDQQQLTTNNGVNGANPYSHS